jgi:ribonuclease P protein component
MPRAANPRRLTFRKEKRLTRVTEFARVRSEGTRHQGRILMLGVLEPKDEKSFRTGFVTSKRVGGAVVRNRLRRRLREIVRADQQRLRAGFWCVVIARPAAARASYRALKDEWLHLAERASILAP